MKKPSKKEMSEMMSYLATIRQKKNRLTPEKAKDMVRIREEKRKKISTGEVV